MSRQRNPEAEMLAMMGQDFEDDIDFEQPHSGDEQKLLKIVDTDFFNGLFDCFFRILNVCLSIMIEI